MTQWPKQSDLAALHALFGNPDANGDGAADPGWYAAHMTTIVPPYQMFYGKTPVTRISCNKAIAQPLLASLQGILAHYKTENAIRDVGLHHYDGCYNFRSKRLGTSLSQHAYGAAIDIDAAHNPQGKPGGTMPQAAVDIFVQNGAEWGGSWSPKYRDPMHFQWARV